MVHYEAVQYFADYESSPRTPPSDQERITFQPMLDVQRFRQYVTEEQSRQEEHSIPTVLTGSGVDQEPPTSSSTNGQVTTSGEEDSVPLQDGHGTDQVFAHGRVLAEQDSSSQPPSFLSQESSRTVIAVGPTMGKPGTAY